MSTVVARRGRGRPRTRAAVELPDERPWERLPREKADHHELLVRLIALGPGAKLARLEQLADLPHSTLNTIASEWRHLERARAYHLARVTDPSDWALRQEEHRYEVADEAAALRRKAAAALLDRDLADEKLRDVAGMWHDAARQGDVELGVSGGGTGGGTVNIQTNVAVSADGFQRAYGAAVADAMADLGLPDDLIDRVLARAAGLDVGGPIVVGEVAR